MPNTVYWLLGVTDTPYLLICEPCPETAFLPQICDPFYSPFCIHALFKVCLSSLAKRKQMVNKFKLVSFFNSLSPASQLVSKSRRKWIETKHILFLPKKKVHTRYNFSPMSFSVVVFYCKINFLHPLQIRLSWPWPLWRKKIKLNWTLCHVPTALSFLIFGK